MGRLLVSADLEFSLTPANPADPPVEGHLRGDGTRLELAVSNPQSLADLRGRRWVADFADQLARDGVAISVVAEGTELMVLGARRNSWFQRRLTGSRHIKVRKLRRFARLAARGGLGGSSVFPNGELAPPPTPMPPAPTLLRKRWDVTTTHDPTGGGRPRLVVPPGELPWQKSREFHLRQTVTTIGSHPDSDICLEGIEPHLAEVRRNADDEYVYHQVSRVEGSRINGERVREKILRTGSRVEFGSWTLVYSREEYADHGRPYGGRVGGEAGYQRPQKPLREVPNPASFDER